MKLNKNSFLETIKIETSKNIKIIKYHQYSLVITSFLIPLIAHSAPVINYGEDLSDLSHAYSNQSMHILQIGDSHTAGDYFTEQLRKRLQAEIGDGGLGFAYPAKLPAQRNARHDYQSTWTTYSSKTNRFGGDYPIGGVYASPKNNSSKIILTSQYYTGDTQNAEIVVSGNVGQKISLGNNFGIADITLKNNGWQSFSIPINFPTSIQAEPNIKIGGLWLRKDNHNGHQGGVVSTMGINGATQDYWARWQSNLSTTLSFSKANLVILAYGTNEAFRADATSLTSEMTKAIQTIRQGLPHANIVIIGAPESLKSTTGNCGQRATSLDIVQSQLKQIAQANKTLYWSWQDAMGGRCSMKSWVNKGLAAQDGVHFTRQGYNLAANDLYNGLKTVITTGDTFSSTDSHNNSINKTDLIINNRNTISNNTTDIQNQSSTSNFGNGKICDNNGRCINF